MIGAFISIRSKQLFRGIIGIGLLRMLFLIALLGYFMLFVFKITEDQTNAIYTVLVVSFFCLWIQLNRKDKVFLKTNFGKYKLIYLADYIALSLVVIFFLIIHLQWIALLGLFVAFSLIIHADFKLKQRGLNTKLQRLIPSECFEWKSGVRRVFFILVPVWIIGFFSAFLTGSIPVVMFIIGILPFIFYETGESVQMIIATEKSVDRFICQKLKMHILLYSAVNLPLIVVFVLFHCELWYLPVIEYLVFISVHIYLILMKYAFYEPNNKSQAASAFGAIGALGGILPVFLPIVWVLSVRFFFKSRKNLKIYLNDFD